MNVDVLVVGCGPAGASAAIAAHDAGASVLVAEKRRCGGGNALYAGGFLWDVRGAEAIRHIETLFFGKTDRPVAQAYVAGRERCDGEARWNELMPAYQDLAASAG